jgi:hypothetical protein
MELSAEVRWFWSVKEPHVTARIEGWFQGLGRFPPGGGRHREDVYLVEPGLERLGLKERGGEGPKVDGRQAGDQRAGAGVEVKAFLGERGTVWGASVELWSKWSTRGLALEPHGRMLTRKMRRLRKFDLQGAVPAEIELDADEKPKPPTRPLPAVGCNVELTRVELPAKGEEWWTLGLEAFAPDHDEACRALHRLADNVAKPDLSAVLASSYPEWLTGP